MVALKINGAIDTPTVILDKINNHFEISGNSYPEDTFEYYQPIMQWVNQYIENPNPKTDFIFKLVYFNSSSYKPIFDILVKLEAIKQKGFQASVCWHYKKEDIDMKQAGEEFSGIVDLPFKFIEM